MSFWPALGWSLLIGIPGGIAMAFFMAWLISVLLP